MLYLDTSLELHGLTLFRDYNAPNRYYYMPRSPHLTREGREPLFQLLVYREDVAARTAADGDRDGGGFLTMTVDLGVPDGVLQEVKRELSSRVGGDVDLVAVPFEQGSVRVSALGTTSGAPAADGQTGPGFVENVLGAGKPSLYGDNRAVFSCELSRRGALLMKASIEDGGASQIAVVYELDYRGLMPARECSIKIEFKQCYSHLRSRAQVNTLWFKSDIDVEIERLTKEGHIEIIDVDYLDGGDAAARAEKLQNLAKELATWAFFKPGLQPGQVLAQDRGSLSVYDPTTDATANTAGFTTALETAATGRGDSEDTEGPRHIGRSAVTDTNRVGGEAPPPADSGGTAPTGTGTTSPTSTSAPSGGNRPLTAVERWNQAGRPQAGYLLRSLSQEEQQTITFNLKQVSAVKRTAAPQSSIRFAAGDAALPGRIKMVDLHDPFFDVLSGSAGTSVDLAAQGVRSMLVKLRYGVRPDGSGPKDSKELLLDRTGDRHDFRFALDHRLDLELEYQVVVNYVPGFALGDETPQATTPWLRTSTRNLDVDPRLLGVVFPVTLTTGQIDWNAVKSVQATLEYRDQAGGLQGTSSHQLTQQAQSAVVHVRPRPGGPREFKVTSTYFYQDSHDGPVVQEGRDASTVVLNQPPSKAVAIQVALVDPLNRIKKAVVELAYQPAAGPEQQGLLTLTGDGGSAAWTLFRPSLDDKPRYRCRATVFGVDGTTRQGPWIESAERQLIVGDSIEGMLEIQVRLLAADLTAAGYALAKLRLEYPGAPDWADRDVEKVFEGAPAPFSWRVPMKPGGGREYRYSIEWFGVDGRRVSEGPQTVRDEVLIIVPPARG